MSIVEDNVLGDKLFGEVSGCQAMKFEGFTLQKGEPGLDRDVIGAAAFIGDTVSNLTSLEESSIGDRGELTALVGVKDQPDALASGDVGEGLFHGLDDEGVVVKARLAVCYNASVVEVFDHTQILYAFRRLDVGDVDRPLLVGTPGGTVGLEKVGNLVMGNLSVLLGLATGDGTDVQKSHVAVNGRVGQTKPVYRFYIHPQTHDPLAGIAEVLAQNQIAQRVVMGFMRGPA